MRPGRSEKNEGRGIDVLAWVLLVLAGLAVVRLARIPEDSLFANVVVDDALYFLVPARNFVEGKGFSFDGVHRTSGVQPLWAIVVTILAGLFHDRTLVARAMCVLSGFCWLTAGVFIYLCLRPFRRAMALFVATGWVLTGFSNRLAFMGMENGLHALCFGALVWYGLRKCREDGSEAGGWSEKWSLLVFGTLVALFSLVRTEGGLLALLLGLAIFSGLLRFGERPSFEIRLRPFLFFVFPGFVLVGGWLLFSLLYFGDVIPVSGSVKLFYEESWGGLHGGNFANLFWHLRFVFGTAFQTIVENLEDLFEKGMGMGTSLAAMELFLAISMAVMLLILLGGWLRDRRRSFLSSRGAFLGILLVFVVIHLSMMGILLPHFTQYGTWYFSCELFSFWFLLGHLADGSARICLARRCSPGTAGRWISGAFLLASLGILIGDFRNIRSNPASDPRVSLFLKAGRWMNRNLPPGQTIGALSAGYVSYSSPAHRVVNLDGLVNTREYLEEFLKKGRLVDYLKREGIGYFSDYQTLESWKGGLFWCGHVPREELSLIRWWRMDQGQAYCIWKLWPGEEERRRGFFDPVSRLQFQAEVLGRFEIVGEGREKEIPSGTRIVTSTISFPSGRLAHVLGNTRDNASLGITAERILPEMRPGLSFDGDLELLGFDLPTKRVSRRGRLVFTRYWRLKGRWEGRGSIRFQTFLVPENPGDSGSGRGRFLHEGTPCHGTHPVPAWAPGDLIVETYSLEVPGVFERGSYSLCLGVVEEGRGRLSPEGGRGEGTLAVLEGVRIGGS